MTVVPGFTDEQAFSLKAIMKDAIDETLDHREEQRKGSPCVVDCPRMEKCEKKIDSVCQTLFGPYENPGGLVLLQANTQTTVKWIMRLSGFAIGIATAVATYSLAEIIANAVHH